MAFKKGDRVRYTRKKQGELMADGSTLEEVSDVGTVHGGVPDSVHRGVIWDRHRPCCNLEWPEDLELVERSEM